MYDVKEVLRIFNEHTERIPYLTDKGYEHRKMHDIDDEIIDLDLISDDPSPESESATTKKKDTDDRSERIEKRAGKTVSKRKDKAASARNPLIPITIILSLTTLAAIGLCCYVIFKQSNETVPASGEEIISDLDTELTYSQDEVDALVAEASTHAADQRESELKDYIRTQMSSEDANTSELLRSMFPEDIVYLDSAGYHFVPIEESIPKHSLSANNFSISENGIITYAEGGTVTSRMGIDVSQHQGTIDWEQVADYGVEFAIIRVGYRGYGSGALMLDEYFEENIEGALSAGLEVGVYFFTQAVSEEEIKEETDFIFEAIAPYNVTLPIVIDIEKIDGDSARADALTSEERTNLVKIFCDTVTEKGYEAMIYGNTYSLFAMLDIEQIAEYDIWYAFYNDYLYYPYTIRSWQYTANGTIPGIDGSVDINIWFP